MDAEAFYAATALTVSLRRDRVSLVGGPSLSRFGVQAAGPFRHCPKLLPMPKTLVTFAAVVSLAVLIAGCNPGGPVPGRALATRPAATTTTTTTATTATTKRKLPPRPRDIDVAGLDPCQALTAQQMKTLGFEQYSQEAPIRGVDPVAGVDNCSYGGRSDGFGVLVTFTDTEDAQIWLDPSRIGGVRAKVSVNGYPAVRVTQPKKLQHGLGPSCTVAVDVHDGQYISVYASVTVGVTRTEESLCKSGYSIAALMMTNAANGLVGHLQSTKYDPSVTLPPRPREIDLTDVDPCTLLTGPQLVQLQYDGPGPPAPFSDPLTHSPACAFPTRKEKLASSVSVVRGEDASAWLGKRAKRPVIQPIVIDVGGFPAVQTVAQKNTPEEERCAVMVSVHDGQYVMVNSFSSTAWRTTEDGYCAEARTVAGDVIQTLAG